jgi:hypothetical protein
LVWVGAIIVVLTFAAIIKKYETRLVLFFRCGHGGCVRQADGGSGCIQQGNGQSRSGHGYLYGYGFCLCHEADQVRRSSGTPAGRSARQIPGHPDSRHRHRDVPDQHCPAERSRLRRCGRRDHDPDPDRRGSQSDHGGLRSSWPVPGAVCSTPVRPMFRSLPNWAIPMS